jgi:uncharacterized phage protein (TIGR02218 family)
MQTHLAGNPTTLAWLWKVKRTDGTIFGFTSFDKDIAYDDGTGDGSITYAAKTGFTQSAVAGKCDLSVDNLESQFFLDSSAITEQDLRLAKYDNALIEVRVVNWADLTMGDVWVRTGTLGVGKLQNGKGTAELRRLAYRLTTVLGSSYGPICRAQFGSGLNGIDLSSQWLCMIDVTLYRQTGSVSSVPDLFTIVPAAGLKQVGSATPTAAAPADWFDDGIITFTSGELEGASLEIKSWDGTNLSLYLPMFQVQPAEGDTFTIEPGCNHTVYDCANKYSNIVNFRGEPTIPGQDSALDYPNAAS